MVKPSSKGGKKKLLSFIDDNKSKKVTSSKSDHRIKNKSETNQLEKKDENNKRNEPHKIKEVKIITETNKNRDDIDLTSEEYEENNYSQDENDLYELYEEYNNDNQYSKQSDTNNDKLFSNQVDYFLLSVKYNGKVNKAEMIFYDKVTEKLLFLDDPTNHRPYFIVRRSIDEVTNFIRNLVERYQEFKKIIEIVPIKLQYRLKFSIEEMSKVIVTTPSDVPPIREIFHQNNIKTYESDIRYHLNWIFDTKIIPGLNYKIDNDVPTLSRSINTEIPANEKESDVLKSINSKSTYKDLVNQFLPFFTEPIPTDDILLTSLDIEVRNPPKIFPKANLAQYPINCIALQNNKGKGYVLILEDKEKKLEEDYKKNLPSDVIVEKFSRENDLLERINELINQVPVVFTFNGDDFDIQYLANRLKIKKVPNNKFRYNGRSKTGLIENSVHIDLFKWFNNPAIKTYAYSGKYKKSSLGEIVSSLIDENKIDVEGEISDLPVDRLAFYCWNDAKITLDLIMDDNYLTWKLMILLCRICHIPIDELVSKRVSSWLMYFLYYEHRLRHYLIPNKSDITKEKGMNAQSEALSKDKK
ncbi:MAG: 3'-5' exonuclease, partial [Candidatus Thorarchaeota archaeon]